MTIPVTYKGVPVARIEHNVALNTYVLYDVDGNLLDEIPHYAFLSHPTLRTRGIHGRYRRTSPTAQGRSNPSSRGANAGANAIAPPGVLTVGAIIAAVAALKAANVPKPIEDAGIRAGEITALRAWRARGDRLFSIYVDDYEWLVDRPARGDITRNQGVHAFKDDASLRNYLTLKWMEDFSEDKWTSVFFGGRPPHRPTYVIGTVDLWGEVVEHDRGYRAEFAAVASLDEAVGEGVELDVLRARYCPNS